MQLPLLSTVPFAGLYDYQLRAVAELRAAYAAGHRAAVLQMPTGSGKSHVSAEIVRSAAMRGGVLFTAHLDALLDDVIARLARHGIGTAPGDAVQVRSTQSLWRRGDRPPAALVVLDEAHRLMSRTVRAVIDSYPDARILLPTATPQRGDGRPLGDVATALVVGPTMRELVALGRLAPTDVLCELDTPAKTLSCTPLDAYRRWTPQGRAIVFCGTVRHATETAESFSAAGIPSACLTGKTSTTVRRRIRARLEGGELRVMAGVGVFIEGWDWPACDTVILARGFGLVGPYLQAVGRGMRAYPGKARCTVLDLAGSALALGLPDEDRTWSLDGTAVRRAEALPAIQRCRACGALYRPAAACPRCGARAPAVTGKTPHALARADRLTRLDRMDPVDRDRRYLDKLERVARERMGLPDAAAARWALGRFVATRGRHPAMEEAK